MKDEESITPILPFQRKVFWLLMAFTSTTGNSSKFSADESLKLSGELSFPSPPTLPSLIPALLLQPLSSGFPIVPFACCEVLI